MAKKQIVKQILIGRPELCDMLGISDTQLRALETTLNPADPTHFNVSNIDSMTVGAYIKYNKDSVLAEMNRASEARKNLFNKKRS
jgi:hypothetical protein